MLSNGELTNMELPDWVHLEYEPFSETGV
jgi:hypothetical protein